MDERAKKILDFAPKRPEYIQAGADDYLEKAQKNCENMIGVTKVPLGVAGPLKFAGSRPEKDYVIPLATTEGALVASVNRGCKAISTNGGAAVSTKRVGITRAPVFRVRSQKHAADCVRWLEDNLSELREATKETSSHCELIKVETRIAGRFLFVKFYFDSKDAMGMNMAVMASDNIIKSRFTPATGAECIALSGNLCTDKKPAAVNLVSERGFAANAEVILSKEYITSQLKTTAECINEVYEAKIVAGSTLAGALGHNAHAANIIAALYLATGQDIAHTVEGSLATTLVELNDDGSLYFNVYLPGIVCGVVGGGTQLPAQKEAMELIGIDFGQEEGGANEQFAEVVAASVLAGEISLLSALASQDLAKAHNNARNR